jgi:hypothetical protein
MNGAVAYTAVKILERLRNQDADIEHTSYGSEHGALEDLLSGVSLSIDKDSIPSPSTSLLTPFQKELLKFVSTLIDDQVEKDKHAQACYSSASFVERLFYLGQLPANDQSRLEWITECEVLERCYSDKGERAEIATKALHALCDVGMLECDDSKKNESRHYRLTSAGRINLERFSAEQTNVADG